MLSWGKKWFFFLVLTFLIYVVAKGDLPAWKKILTQKAKSSGGNSFASPSSPTGTQAAPMTGQYGPNLQPLTPQTPMVVPGL